MADRLKTFTIPVAGGLILNQSEVAQAQERPGSATNLINFEPGLYGGYRRLSGYTKFDSNEVPNVCVYGVGVYGSAACIYGGSLVLSGAILGVSVFRSGVIVGRNEHVFATAGTGYTRINGTDYRTSATKWRYAKYNWASAAMIMVDGGGFAVKWDGTTYTILSGSGCPTAPSFVEEFSSHIFYGSGTVVQFGAPNQDAVFDTAAGGGRIQFGDTLTGLKRFRDALYIFGRTRISRLTGTSSSNFAISGVSADIGCVAPDSIQEINGDLIFLGPDGFRNIAGTERIGDVELGNLSKPIQAKVNTITSDYTNGHISSVLVRAKSQYRLFASLNTDAQADAYGILGGLRTNSKDNAQGEHAGVGWEWAELRGIKATCAASGYIGTAEYVMHGGFDGYLYRQEQGNDFNGSNILAVFKTPYLVFDDPAIRKTLYKLDTYYRVEGVSQVTVQVNFDYDDVGTVQPPSITITNGTAIATYGTALYGTGAYGLINTPRVKSNLIGSGLNASLMYTSNDMLASYTIQSIVIQYGIEGRR